MKLAIFTLTTLITYMAHANPECFEFDVRKNSSELTTVRISILKEKNKTSASVSGKTSDKQITNNFSCKGSIKISCEHPEGAGDFTIEIGNEATLIFSYVNLAIGAKGPNAPKPDEEINEDFAFLDKSASGTDEEEDAGHLGEVTLKGKKVSCSTKF